MGVISIPEDVQGKVLEADGFAAKQVGGDHGVQFASGGDGDAAGWPRTVMS